MVPFCINGLETISSRMCSISTLMVNYQSTNKLLELPSLSKWSFHEVSSFEHPYNDELKLTGNRSRPFNKRGN
jgi:hypothetical protein